jgi:S1-C subfamily serine protease
MRFIHGLLPIICGVVTPIILVHPMALAIPSASEIAAYAEKITVRIDGQNPGSGVLFARKGQTYYVLTSAHVVATEDEYVVVTPDNQRQAVVYKRIKKLAGADLAIIQFDSPNSYQLAKLGDSNQSQRGTVTYVSGWPAGGTAITKPTLLFTQGLVSASPQVAQSDGYELIYTNNTLPGMSGGPVLNAYGHLIGIHGRAETARQEQTANPDIVLKVGLNLGIPINLIMTLVPKAGLNLALRQEILPPPPPMIGVPGISPVIDGQPQRIRPTSVPNRLICGGSEC